MFLYAGSSQQFIADAKRSKIANLLREAHINHLYRKPSPSEYQSWQNSLFRMAVVLDDAALRDHGIIVEYLLLPSRSRLDCMITGLDDKANANAVVIEL